MTSHPAHLQFINPPTMATPPGFTQVVEVRRLALDDLLLEIEAVVSLPA